MENKEILVGQPLGSWVDLAGDGSGDNEKGQDRAEPWRPTPFLCRTNQAGQEKAREETSDAWGQEQGSNRGESGVT